MRRLILLLSTCLAMTGCWVDYSHEAQHQNFLRMFNNTGKDIRNSYKKLPSGVLLPNGLIEIKVKLINRNCYTYEQYDPNTFIVKNWRWEGGECTAAS